jgi:hypothetical protein
MAEWGVPINETDRRSNLQKKFVFFVCGFSVFFVFGL